MLDKKYRGLLCEGPLCSPWKHGVFTPDSISASCNMLKIAEDEEVSIFGWEYRMIQGKSFLLCPVCQKELANQPLHMTAKAAAAQL